MKRIIRWAPGLLTTAVVCAAGAAAQEGKCLLCHPQERVAYVDSVHAGEGIGCVDCHGGDASASGVEAAHRSGFRPLTDRRTIPAACASCHSDLERMRPYNLPVDQYAIYQTSQHGRAVARGELRAAVCSDCHGSHAVLPASDPESPISRGRVARTCARCHADAELMDDFGLDSGVVEKFVESVHGRQLLEAGNGAAPACIHCHGVHGATPPGFGDLDKVCGACHREARQAFLDGPHYRGMLEAELPECSSCHGSHETVSFTAGDIEALCADCHGTDSSQARAGRKMHALIQAAEVELEQAEALVSEGGAMALDVEDHATRIREGHSHLVEALPLVHSVSVEAVEQATRRARSIGEQVQLEVHEQLDRTSAHIGLTVFWFYLLLTFAILLGQKRRLARGDG